jgi:carboxypeptidase C (cathepsin A)
MTPPRYIDQPAGTGFSYPVSGTDAGEVGVGRDMYDFLQHFFQVRVRVRVGVRVWVGLGLG